MANPEVLQFSEKFETVMISPGLSENPLAVNTPAASTTAPIAGDGIKIKEVKIETAPGVTTLAELFKNPEKFEGKTIKVQGQCVPRWPLHQFNKRFCCNKQWSC